MNQEHDPRDLKEQIRLAAIQSLMMKLQLGLITNEEYLTALEAAEAMRIRWRPTMQNNDSTLEQLEQDYIADKLAGRLKLITYEIEHTDNGDIKSIVKKHYGWTNEAMLKDINLMNGILGNPYFTYFAISEPLNQYLARRMKEIESFDE